MTGIKTLDKDGQEVIITLAPGFESYLAALKNNTEEPQNQPTVELAAPIKDESYEPQTVKKHNPTHPLSLDEYKTLKEYFLGKECRYKNSNNSVRNFLYVVLQTNWGARCGDIIQMRVSDVLESVGSKGVIKKYAEWIQEKTGEPQRVLINTACKDALTIYFSTIKEYRDSDWLFPNYKNPVEHISVGGARKLLQRACDELGISEGKHIGTHSLRKTFGNIALNKSCSSADLVYAAKHLGHKSVNDKYLLHYIGMEQQEYDRYIEENGI